MTISLSGPTEIGTESSVHWQEFAVPYRYPVHFTENLFAAENPTLARTVCRLEPELRHRCLFFVDDGVAKAIPELVESIVAYAARHACAIDLVARPIEVPGGERIKQDLFFVEQMQQAIYEHHIDRHSFVVAVGGGAVLDAVGLVAATSHRGVRHIRVPTTVLAQNDSGVGVKNGVNLYNSKNFVGTFAPPFAVLNDLAFVDRLPARDRIGGLAEAVKVALIRDATFFVWLERNAEALATFSRPETATMIRRCAELHMRQIAHGGDPFESGSARPLDYGHWSAHKLESLTRHHVRHGEAVAIGVALDTRYSVRAGLLVPGSEDRVACLLELLGFRLWHPALEKREADGRLAIMVGLQEFREHLGGELTVTLLKEIGVGIEVHEIDTDLMAECIGWLAAREGR